MHIRQKNNIPYTLLLLFYLFTVLWFTVLARSTGISIVHDDFFWSYRELLSGNWKVGLQILANIAMFIPFGFLLSAIIFRTRPGRPKTGWKSALAVFFCAFAFSALIELLQLYGMRGTFELDDLLSNTLGALAGTGIRRITHGRKRINAGISAGILIVCAGILIRGGDFTLNESDALPKAFCFQTETAQNRDGTLSLAGVAFRYNHPEWAGTIVLRSTDTDEEIQLTTEREERPEVNAYFRCEQDYSGTGFRATGTADSETEYEILIRFPFSALLPTGEYVTGERIHYGPERETREPEAAGTDLEEIIREGALRVYRPDAHCWVYQAGRKLYWIAEDGFVFEEDGATGILYHLWTTQPERLPENRLKYGVSWDNLSGSFEKHELQGNFGKYRVSCREMPDEYAITTIQTGYSKNNHWIWQEYFRPGYEWPAQDH